MTVGKRHKPHDSPSPKCGAKKKQSPGRCTRPAGWGTDHAGQGKCKLHGGATPIKSGRYSTLKSEAIRVLYERNLADPDPLNILPELAQCRAIFQDYLDRYQEWRDALLAWHESFRAGGDLYVNAVRRFKETLATKNVEKIAEALNEMDAVTAAALGKPHQVLDQADAFRILSEITKIVERIERIKAANAISRPEMFRVMDEMGRVVDRALERNMADAGDRARAYAEIKDGWLGIHVA